MRILPAALAGVLLSLDVLAAVGAPASTLSVTSSAVLLQPGSSAYEGVLLQNCVGGAATIRVALATPILIQQQNALLVLAEGSSTPVVRADASGDMLEIAAFDGTSAMGCLASGTNVTLVLNEGGLLGSLEIVIGSAVVR